MRSWLVAVALVVSFTPAAHARGIRARIEGPGLDGRTYTVHTDAVDANTSLEPWALAEGVVNGRHQSVLLRVQPLGEPGAYRITRAWPDEGRWTIRFLLGHPPAPATVAILRADGSVRSNRFYFNTDGFKECMRALHARRGADC